MTFSEAKKEFAIRYYLWAISEFEKEIEKSFPNLRAFKVGPIWELCEFMQLIEKSEQLILSRGLLKKFHPNAVKLLGETFSDDETFLISRCNKFRSQFDGLAANKDAGKQSKFVSKSQLRKIIVAKFTKSYGNQCVKILTAEGWDPWFEIKLAGWVVTTQFTFGRRESLINYYHAIETEKRIPNPQFPPEFWMPAMRLEHLISFASWLGICSQTEWKCVTEDDVDRACEAAIMFCGLFFEIAPKLLKGLELEKIEKGDPASVAF